MKASKRTRWKISEEPPPAQAWLHSMRDMIVNRSTNTNDSYTAMCVVIVAPHNSDETTVMLPGSVDQAS